MRLFVGGDGKRWVAETLYAKSLLQLENLCVRAKIEENIFVYSRQLIRKGSESHLKDNHFFL